MTVKSKCITPKKDLVLKVSVYRIISYDQSKLRNNPFENCGLKLLVKSVFLKFYRIIPTGYTVLL